MTQMRAVNGHGFAVGQYSYIVPIHFVIAKTGPTVRSTFHQELLQRATFGCRKEQLAGIGIIKVDFAHRRRLLGNILDEGGLFKVTRVFGIVSIKVANAIGRVAIAIPA
jgi:hypothetical protein